MTTHLVIPDQHAHPSYGNERADLLSKLIIDLKPDVVINLGDAADMPSLCSYDKGKRAFHGRTYRADIDSHLEFQDRIWGPVRQRRKRLPRAVFCIGNHEWRIEKALDLSPELVGSIGLRDLQLERWYDDIVPYNGSTPGSIDVDGVTYAHYVVSGLMGRPVGGEHSAHSLLRKQLQSTTVGHSHLVDFNVLARSDGRKVLGCVAGVYQDWNAPFAGESNRFWWRGVVIKHGVENGCYDPEFVSIERLKRIYG